MNNEAIASILSALTGNNNIAQLATSFLGALNVNQPAQAQAQASTNTKAETVKNLTAIAELCVNHAVVGPYMSDDHKKTVNMIVSTVNYLGPALTYQQADIIIKDLNIILNAVEQNIMNKLTQVLQSAGIRM